MTTQIITATPAADVEELPSPLVLAGQIADLTDTLHNTLCASGQLDDYAALLNRLRSATSSLADCNAQIAANVDRHGNPQAKSAAGHAEWHFGQAAHWLAVAGDLISDSAE